MFFSSSIEVSFAYHKIYPLYVYSSEIFGEFVQLWSCYHSTFLEYFYLPKKFTQAYLQSIPIPISASGKCCSLTLKIHVLTKFHIMESYKI